MSNFYLKVQHVENLCTFELSWGKGQHLNVKTAYPLNLTVLYQVWQRCYLSYYSTLSLSTRGRVADAGILKAPAVDLHAQLVQAEAQLLSEFHKWLRCAELFEIRAVIASVASAESKGNATINLFLICDSLELERLPWEVWEIGTEFALGSNKIRISRTSLNIRKAIEQEHSTIQRKVRLLAILGDDSGLDFQAEKKAIYELRSIADVTFVGWQAGKNIQDLKNEIKDVIISDKGWDILFFAGHSNETNLTGGEIGIAPNVALSIGEIASLLSQAIEKGLKFAIFNSCKGLNIANSLIDLGMSQVAVMREPIHNNVAVEFLIQFLKALSQYKDVHEAMLLAAQYLKTDKNLTYPGAYLIPSLFRHPNAELFCIKPFGVKAKLKKLIPGAKEAVLILILILISSNLSVTKYLLSTRLLIQAIYRQSTSQLEKQTTPPVLLVQIDNESRSKALSLLPRIKPIGHEYIAELIKKLTALNAKVVGIDYLLDTPQGQGDIILANALKTAIKSPSNTWFTFAQTNDKNNELLTILPSIAQTKWSFNGEIEILPGYMELSEPGHKLSSSSKFSTLLAVSQQLKSSSKLKLDLNSQDDFCQQINSFLVRTKKDTILNLPRTHLQPITEFSYYLHQMWLYPIIDFSIPPNQVYQPISAWQLLDGKNVDLSRVHEQVVIIAPGGYGSAGIFADNEDNFDLPPAAKYWRLQQSQQENPRANSPILTGGEAHAYMVHHLLNKRLVIPIPDLWMVGIAIILGKCLSLYIRENVRYRWRWFALLGFSTAIYGILSLQIYITAVAILIPWLLPSLTLWIYTTPALIKKS